MPVISFRDVGSVGQGEIISILKNEQRAAAPSIRRSCYDLREGTASTHDVAQQQFAARLASAGESCGELAALQRQRTQPNDSRKQ